MKKWLLILGMITCMAGLTACGQKEEGTPLMTSEEAEVMGKAAVATLHQFVTQNAQDQAATQLDVDAIASWEAALEDMGSYEEVIGVTSEFDEKDGTIEVEVKGSVRNAVVELVYDNGTLISVTTNVEYSTGEIIKKAAMNTLIGMGTVFCVLILISLIISCFGVIPKIQAMFTKKPVKEETESAVDNTIAQIIEKEEQSDDLELIAVIAAAIAASEGAASTDGFVVRSIRRVGSRW